MPGAFLEYLTKIWRQVFLPLHFNKEKIFNHFSLKRISNGFTHGTHNLNHLC